jgi:hypothetical protein
LIAGVYNSAPPLPQSGQAVALQTDSEGNLLVSIVAGGTASAAALFAPIAVSASGVTNILAAVASKSIRVLAVQLVANAAVNIKWQSHVTPTDLTGLAYLAANGGYVLPYNTAGWFQTIAGEALDINLSAAVAVGGSIVYVTV